MVYSLLNKFEREIEKDLAAFFKPLVSLSEEIEKININSSCRNNKIETLPLLFYWLQVEMYLKYSNGGIGYDMFVAHRFLWQMQSYKWILLNGNLEENEKEKCNTEIKLNFYILLNCIYNIKEKWLEFINFKKRQNTIFTSILNKKGQKELKGKLNLLYKDIKKICSARDCLVHYICTFYYNEMNKTLQITQSKFTLSEDRVWRKSGKKTCYKFTGQEILNTFIALENHRKKILLDLSNTENIDSFKLKEKYFNETNKSYDFGLL